MSDLPRLCWMCWWREGRRCFAEHDDLPPLKLVGGLREGHEITPAHLSVCASRRLYKGKRRLLESLFGDVPVHIESERRLK